MPPGWRAAWAAKVFLIYRRRAKKDMPGARKGRGPAREEEGVEFLTWHEPDPGSLGGGRVSADRVREESLSGTSMLAAAPSPRTDRGE